MTLGEENPLLSEETVREFLHRPIDALSRIPCGTFMTIKRCIGLLLHICEAHHNKNIALAQGLTAQGLRRLILQLYLPARPDLAWQATYLP